MKYGDQVRKATHAYVGYCPCGCGNIVAATVDTPGFAEHAADAIRDFKKSGIKEIEWVEIARTASLMPCQQKIQANRKEFAEATAQGSLPLGGS